MQTTVLKERSDSEKNVSNSKFRQDAGRKGRSPLQMDSRDSDSVYSGDLICMNQRARLYTSDLDGEQSAASDARDFVLCGRESGVLRQPLFRRRCDWR